MPSRSPVPIGDRLPPKLAMNGGGAFGSPDVESDETKTTGLSDLSPRKRIGRPALTRTEILRQQNRQRIKDAALNGYLTQPNGVDFKRSSSNSPPNNRRANMTRIPGTLASPRAQLPARTTMMPPGNRLDDLRRVNSDRSLSFIQGRVNDEKRRAPLPEDFEDRRLALGDSLPNEVVETPDDVTSTAETDVPKTGAIAAEEQLIGTVQPDGVDQPEEEQKRDTTAPVYTTALGGVPVVPVVPAEPAATSVSRHPRIDREFSSLLQQPSQPRTGMIALGLHNEDDVRRALEEIENATKDIETTSASSSTPPQSPPFKGKPRNGTFQTLTESGADGGVPAPIVPPQPHRNRGGGMLAQALSGEDIPPPPIVPPQLDRGGGMLAQALGHHVDLPREASVEHKGTFIPKQSSRESSAESDEKQKNKDVKKQQSPPAGVPGASAEKMKDKDIDLSKLDPSTRLLMLCKRGEWIMVESSLHAADKKKFDLSMTDEHGFTPLLLAIKDGRTAVAERMLQLGADMQAATKDKRTVAHIAAMYGKEDVMKFLLNKKADVTKPAGSNLFKIAMIEYDLQPNGQLPLHYACSRPSTTALPLVQLLLKSTAVHDKDSRLIEDKLGALPLHHAVESSNVAVTRELLLQHGDKQVKAQTGETGDTAMHIACRNRNIEIVKLLVEHGANANARNAHGRTPLHEVAEVGDEALLRIMYGLKADATIVDNEDKTPLHVAAEKGHTTVVEILVDKFKGSIMARTKDGSTLMHIAAFNGHSQTALAFLKRGVPMNMPNKTGALGLHCAAAMGHNEVVKTLIAKGTPVDIKTKENYTALHVAVQSGKPDVVETLLGQGADVHVQGGPLGETALHIASGLTGPDARACAEMLLKSGAEANVPQSNGETALHIAARFGRPEMIRLLLSEDADPMAASEIGETPLHVAARNCNYEAAQIIVKYVEDRGGQASVKKLVNYKNTDGLTALHYAAEIRSNQLHHPGEDAQLMNLLIDSGGDVSAQSQLTSETVMHHCARSGNEAVLLAIVNKIGPGAVQIVQNKQSKNGWSPLLEACDRGHTGVVKLLLEHHARIDVFDEFGRTGLHLAASNGHLELTDLLLRHKAFVNSKSKAGEAPLHLASMNGHTKVVNLLVQDHGAALEAITLENQTALHFAAKFGQLAVSSALLALGANANARDNKGQTPLHLAAENDFPEVVKLFLKMKQNNRSVLTAVDDNGFTCAHIAAMKGSIAVVKELMMIDKAMVIEAKTKTTESTTLHMAAAGGHKNIVKILLENGADPEDENAHGMTALHLGAKNGFVRILEVFEKGLLRRCSRKTGLNAMHIAAYYGQSDFVSEMLSYVPASCRSEPPIYNHLVVKELATEYGLTPLHLAAQSGNDGLVRMLLNQGVQVDATTTTMSVIPLHLAAQQGNIAVVGMLLSRSTQQQHVKDSRGRTPLHLAAMNGHYDMVSLLIAQGSNINVMDQNGWTGMHFATKAGHLNVLRLFVKSSADPQAETKEGKIPLCFAAAHGHIDCLHYLLLQNHDTHLLMEDRKFVFDLMVCGKGHTNQPLQEFILRSPAPIDTAVKLSSLYKDMSEKEKERARDLSNVSVFAENMAVELLGIAATEYNPALLLKAHDARGRPFLDILIENEQKEVVSYASVQRYLTEIWMGRINWSFGKMIAFTLFVLLCPPAWFFFSLPLDNRIGRAPIIKFVCHIVSHVYFTILLTVVVLNIAYKMYNVTSIWPNPIEWVLIIWLSGNLVSELTSVGGRSGLGIVKLLILILAALAMAAHIFAFVYPMVMMSGESDADQLHFVRTMQYLKNQFFAFALLFAFVQYLDFLTVHHLFGPWAIIIRELMSDLARFLVILILFIAGFTLHVTSIFQPCYQPIDDDSAQLMRLASPDQTLEMLFFSMFGLVEPDNMPPLHLVPDFAKIILKVVFGIYMMVTLIVLINLLIAMMSDTYQRIQAQSDTEWKFGRAMLIRQMNKRSATPAPINMLTKFISFVKVAWKNRFHVCTLKAQDDLRYEDNIDAYSMSGNQGRATPALKMLSTGDDNEIGDNAELGHSSEWKIETVIDWRRVVEIFYQLNGRPTVGLEELAVSDAIAAENVTIEVDGVKK